MSGSAPAGGGGPALAARQRWQIAGITAGALLVWLGLRALSGPPTLSPMDFVVGGSDALQFCDPNHPRFLPVVTRSLPVTLKVAPSGDRLMLTTVTGKPVGPRDVAPTDGFPLRLFLVNRALTRFYAAEPGPADRPGEWRLAFDRRTPEPLRIFADLTPAALGREIYASADLPALGPPAGAPAPAAPPEGGWRFELASAPARLSALQPALLTLSAERADGAPAVLTLTGGYRAHLVAFDEACTGMAHLRSVETTASPPGRPRAQASFEVTFPDSGPYVLWAQLELNGRPVLERFTREVTP
jgi:hypothetical protein